jgi:hypothetical protein
MASSSEKVERTWPRIWRKRVSAVILAPLRRLEKAEARERTERQKTNQTAETGLKRLAIEEERILDAYRTGVISPAQLSQQLEAVKVRRNAIAVQQTELQTEHAQPEKARETVSDYCADAARNLTKFTPERWRELLQTVVRDVLFEGDRITIHGRIGLGPTEPGVEFTVPPSPLLDSTSQ